MSEAANAVDKLVRGLKEVRKLQHALWNGGLQPGPVSIDDLIELICKQYGCTISVKEGAPPNHITFRHLVSLIERRAGNKFDILVRATANEFEKRYGVIKELCHIFGDTEEDFEPKGQLTLKSLLDQQTADLYNQTLELGAGRGFESEKRAERLAEELSYDFRLRASHSVKVKSAELTVERLSLTYLIPSSVVLRVHRPLALELYKGLWNQPKK